MQRALAALVLVTGLGLATSVSAQATLVSGLGGPFGFGDGMLAPDDDEFSVEVDVLPAFPDGLTFFGTNYSSLWVNTNGNISFGMPIMAWTPRPFPIASRPMIALWWADVDTLAGPMPDGGNTVYFHVEPGRVVVTWYQVGYWNVHTDPSDSFQLIITPGTGPLGAFDAEFRYAQCNWSTADSSGGLNGLPVTRTDTTCVTEVDCPEITASPGEFGYECVLGHCVGTPAQAGYDAGDLTNFLALPGSRTPEILNLCMLSNLTPAEPGVFRFADELRAPVPVCGNTFRETGEQCDDGNLTPGDGCDATCITERCGDGMIQPMLGEECDDSNTISRDGCSSFCLHEPCFDVTMDAGPCDAGVPLDANVDAAPGEDADIDAARIDAARIDAGPPVLSVGGSGCSCRVSGRHAHAPTLLASLVLALAVLRRRRRTCARRFHRSSAKR